MLTDGHGEPVCVLVYAGNTSDLNTSGAQVHKLKHEFVGAEANTRAHAFTAMVGLKLYRYLERAWSGIDVRVEEGLRELEQICVMELVHGGSGEVIARMVPGPNQLQKQLLDALGLSLPTTVGRVEGKVVTRKKIAGKRKTKIKAKINFRAINLLARSDVKVKDAVAVLKEASSLWMRSDG